MQTPTTIEEVAQLAGETNSEHYAWFAHERNKEAEQFWIATDFRDIKSMADDQGYQLIPWGVLFDMAVNSAVKYREALG